MSRFVLAIFFYLILMVTPNAVSADTSCPSVYGAPCPTGAVSINKTIKNPSTGEFVDTLGGSRDPHFLPENTVSFRLRIQNNGSGELTNIAVQDKFPDFTDFVSGMGIFDNRTLNFTIDSLKPGEFRDIDVVGRVQHGNNLPNSGLVCVTNFAQASVSNQQPSSDTSVFCIETQVLGLTQALPKTGPANTIFAIAGSTLMLITSAFFFKKARG